MALVACPCAFRLRGLAQSLPREFCFIFGRGIFLENSPVKWLFCNVQSSFRFRRLAQNSCRGPGVRHFPCEFSHKIALVACPCVFRLRRLVQVSKLFLLEILVPPYYVHARSCKQKLFWRSWWRPLYLVLDLYRSLSKDLLEVLLKPSSRGLCIKILKYLEDALRWWLSASSCGMFVGSSRLKIVWGPLYWSIGPAAAVALMSNLICSFAIAAVACLWHIDFLPPTLLAASCRCYYFLLRCTILVGWCGDRCLSLRPSPKIWAVAFADRGGGVFEIYLLE